jgi:hypothetical protein
MIKVQSMKKKTVGLLAACVLASGTSAVAFAADGDRPPSVAGVDAPQALPAPQGRSLTVLDHTARVAPAERFAKSLAEFGVVDPTVARTVEGREVVVGESPRGLLCMAVGDPTTGRAASTCQNRETVAQGMLWVQMSGEDTGGARIYGVAPDGVKTVALTAADGTEAGVPVSSNVYSAPAPKDVKRIQWKVVGSETPSADLRLP